MIPACGIETKMSASLVAFSNFQINDSRLRDWNAITNGNTGVPQAFKLMIPACGIET